MADSRKPPAEEATIIDSKTLKTKRGSTEEATLIDNRKPAQDEATLIKSSAELDVTGYFEAAPTYPVVEVQAGPKRQGERFILPPHKEVTVGRANTSVLMLEDNSVSRSHCLIREDGGKYFLRDLGSRNGTAVNQKKIQEDHLLKHEDQIKVGIYVLRFLEEEAAPPEETPKKEEPKAGGSKSVSVVSEEKSPAVVPTQETAQINVSKHKKPFPVKAVLIASVIVIVLVVIGVVGYPILMKKKPAPVPPVIPQKPKIIVPIAETVPETTVVSNSIPDEINDGPTIPILVEVDSKPLPAKILYKGKEIGSTPFKVTLQVPAGKPQELVAVYRFEELKQDFTDKRSFTVSKQDELASVHFDGALGALQVRSLPKNVQFYLEGTLSAPNNKDISVKIDEINYTQPIYLPFGKYKVELKKSEKVEGAETVVDSVKYRREFTLSKENTQYELALSDKDLQIFPAQIKTDPTGAEVLVNGKKYGDTFFDGSLPLGKGTLVLRKEGYFDHEQPLNISLNTPLVIDVKLTTSQSGQYINKARALIRQGQHQQAIDQLSEGLKNQPSPAEVAQIQLLLGNSYIQTGAYDIAIGYFEKAKGNPETAGRAKLGIAQANFSSGNKDQALAGVIDLMVNEKNESVKADAENLFRKISPIRSVMLISTEPSGAKVWMNDQEIPQATPVLLSDLGLGSYRIAIEKDGFKRYESKVQLVLSSFKPVIVKLEPIR